MKGTIRIKVIPCENGSRIKTAINLKSVSHIDKLCLIKSFLKGLDISPAEAALHLMIQDMADRKEDKSNE